MQGVCCSLDKPACKPRCTALSFDTCHSLFPGHPNAEPGPCRHKNAADCDGHGESVCRGQFHGHGHLRECSQKQIHGVVVRCAVRLSESVNGPPCGGGGIGGPMAGNLRRYCIWVWPDLAVSLSLWLSHGPHLQQDGFRRHGGGCSCHWHSQRKPHSSTIGTTEHHAVGSCELSEERAVHCYYCASSRCCPSHWLCDVAQAGARYPLCPCPFRPASWNLM